MSTNVSDPIRILHVLTAMNMAGTETLLMNLYRNIDRTKVQFDFAVSTENSCAYDAEITSLGGKIIHYPLYRPNVDFRYRKWWNRFFVEHPEYKIIHGHIGSTAAIYLSIAKKHGCFTIAHSHSTSANVSLKEIGYKLYSYPTRYIADQFFGCSMQALIDRYGKRVALGSKAKVINNAIDAEKYIYNSITRVKIREKLGIEEQQLIIGTVGRLTFQKNPYEIIRICSELKRKGLEYKFLWYGTGELKEEIKRRISDEKLDDTIYLMGTRSDIYNVLQAFDIFLFPSLSEGLGIACVEAQAAGLPTLCSNTVPEEAKITNECLFLPLNNTKKWSDEIEKIAKKVVNKEFIRQNTYRDVLRAGYDIKEVSAWLENFYVDTMERLKHDCSMHNFELQRS